MRKRFMNSRLVSSDDRFKSFGMKEDTLDGSLGRKSAGVAGSLNQHPPYQQVTQRKVAFRDAWTQ
jgi:hypothetical protein